MAEFGAALLGGGGGPGPYPPRDGAGSAEISPVGYTSLKLLVFAKEPQ